MDIKSFIPLDANALRGFFFSPAPILTLIALWLGTFFLKALYNISPFHPLSRFPGPKIAAASYAYEAYHDWIQGGRYGTKIADMHKRYGEFDLDPLRLWLGTYPPRPHRENQPRRAPLRRPLLRRRDLHLEPNPHPRQMAASSQHGRCWPSDGHRLFDRFS